MVTSRVQIVQDYLDLASRDGSSFNACELELDEVMRQSCEGRILDRPLFVGSAELRRFAAAVLTVYDAILALGDRVFCGDLGRFATALQISAPATELMARTWGSPTPRFGRADMYDTADGFALLELNVGSEIGGLDRAGQLPGAFLGLPAVQRLTRDHSCSYVNTTQVMANQLIDAGRLVTGGRSPIAGLVDAPDSLATNGTYWRALAGLLTSYGLPTVVGHVGQLTLRGDFVMLDGQQIDVALRYASVEEILGQPSGAGCIEPLLVGHESGTVALWTPPHTNLLGNKGCLAILSDPIYRQGMSPETARAVDGVLPWTRSLNPALEGRSEAEFDGLITDCLARRQRLVLKPNAGHGGLGVVPGWHNTAQEWRARLTEATNAPRGYIVQERVDPRPEPVVNPDTGTVGEVHAAWGLFVSPSGYAGAYARAMPRGLGQVIGLGANVQTTTAAVLEISAPMGDADAEPS